MEGADMTPRTGEELTRQNRQMGVWALLLQQAVMWPLLILAMQLGGTDALKLVIGSVTALFASLIPWGIFQVVYTRVHARHLDRIYGKAPWWVTLTR
jgi:hypothetical protein